MADRRAAIFGTEKDQQNCPFYLKIGACRHGDRCSRLHNKPVISQTILLPNLYQSPISKKAVEASGGIAPNISDAELQQHFDEFYEDIFEGLAKYGQVDLLNVCANLGDHLVGNVYVKYQKDDDANESIKGLKGRFYDGRPIISEFSPVTDFTEARCRQYDIGTCNRGGFCNFMHLHNPSKTLYHKLFGDRKSRSPSPRKERDSYRDRGGYDRGGRGGGGYDRDNYRDRDGGGYRGGRSGGYDRDNYRDRDGGYRGGGGYDRDREGGYGRSRDSYDNRDNRRPYGEYNGDRNSRGSKSPDYPSRNNDIPPPPANNFGQQPPNISQLPSEYPIYPPSTTIPNNIPNLEGNSNLNSVESNILPSTTTTAETSTIQPPSTTTTEFSQLPTQTILQAPLSTGSSTTTAASLQSENGSVIVGEKRGREDTTAEPNDLSDKRLKADGGTDESNSSAIQWASTDNQE